MKLSDSERDNLFEALLDAYPDYDKLKIMVKLKLGQNLARISEESDLEIVVFNLIGWAESTNKLIDLVWGAYERNKGNLKIKKIIYKLCIITKKQWQELYELLDRINSNLIKTAVCRAFEPKDIKNVDPELAGFETLTDFEKIKPILKTNLLKKGEKSPEGFPVIFKFACCLSQIEEEEINTIREDLQHWINEVAQQLNIQDYQNLCKPQPTSNRESELSDRDTQELTKSSTAVQIPEPIIIKPIDRRTLRGEINKFFEDEASLNDIFFFNNEIFGDNFYQNLPGTDYRTKVRSLISELERRNLTHKFIKVVREEYPNFAKNQD